MTIQTRVFKTLQLCEIEKNSFYSCQWLIAVDFQLRTELFATQPESLDAILHNLMAERIVLFLNIELFGGILNDSSSKLLEQFENDTENRLKFFA